MSTTHIIDGQSYKIGLHGFVFRLDSFGDWIRSTVTVAEIVAHAAARAVTEDKAEARAEKERERKAIQARRHRARKLQFY